MNKNCQPYFINILLTRWVLLLLFFCSPVIAQDDRAGALETLLGLYIIAAMVEEAGGVDENRAMNVYLNTVFERVKASSRRDGVFTTLILDSDDINAFAAPGGYFAVTRGLLQFIRSDDEVACVLGHELGHFEHKHGLATFKRKLGFIFALSALDILLSDPKTDEQVHKRQAMRYSAEIIAMLMELKYSRDNERQADFSGLMHAQKAGYSPLGCVDFMRRLSRFESEANPIELWLKTHPAASERLENMLATLSDIGYRQDLKQQVLTRPEADAYRWRGIPAVARTMKPMLSAIQKNRVKKGLDEMAAFDREAGVLSDEEALNLFLKKTSRD